ncbi:hypothetical protein WJX73_005491 [Symbiochloris irregularis]|uniref:N-acetylgalactosaminide beta-1,3-galactosyltransferase n=1 Tax=Symbiochloris irregularis TaxID=706552 RepID=A0AAW1PMC2_9CHLO
MRPQGPSRTFLAVSGCIAILLLFGYAYVLKQPRKQSEEPAAREDHYQLKPYGTARPRPAKVLQIWNSVTADAFGTSDTHTPGAYWQPFTAPNPPQRYTRDDLIIAFASTHDRLPIVLASRSWRQGVRTLIFMDEPLDPERAPEGLLDGIKSNNEVYEHFVQPPARPGVWSQPGDARAALVSFKANLTFGIDTYSWILNGDDDTVYIVENVLAMVNRFDHALPFHLSDNIWFPEWDGKKDTFVHASRRAPRDNNMILSGWDCRWTKWRPGMWYFSHGGAGTVVSSGLMEKTSYWEMEERVKTQNSFTSGDALFTEAIFSKTRVLVTDPGYGYFRKHIRLFDPGWREFREGDTMDRGNDPMGIIERLESAVKRDGVCDADCEDQMRHTMTVHPAAFLTMRVAEAFGTYFQARGHPYLKNPPVLNQRKTKLRQM